LSEGSSRISVGVVLGIAGAIVGLGGYVLLVGAGVAWLDVHRLGVPAISVVADMPRNELFGLGAEALLAWLALVVVFAIVVGLIGRTAERAPWTELLLLVLATIIGVGVRAVLLLEALWLKLLAFGLLFVLSYVLGLFVARRYEVETQRVPAAIAVGGGLVLGVAMGSLLLIDARATGFVVALIALIAASYAALQLVRRRVLSEEDESERQLIRELGERPFGEPELRRLRQARSAERRRALVRLVVALAALATALAAGAVSSRSSRVFWIARVTTTDGSCVSGTLLVRDGEEVLLAGWPRHIHGGEFENRMVEIPSGQVSSVQVIGPRVPPKHIHAESCTEAGAVAHPAASAPYPLVPGANTPEGGPESEVKVVKGTKIEVVRGPRGARGEAGPRGEPGSSGEAGSAGRPGDKGERGARGETGPRGERGQTGERGVRGEVGTRGPQGRTGQTGPRGERGLTGPRGPRGERGPSPLDGS
jgi:hypothetical protein